MLVKANKYIIPFGVRVAQCFVIAGMYLTFKFKQILKRVAIGKGINDFFFYESNGWWSCIKNCS